MSEDKNKANAICYRTEFPPCFTLQSEMSREDYTVAKRRIEKYGILSSINIYEYIK
jgi:hypothetical protein